MISNQSINDAHFYNHHGYAIASRAYCIGAYFCSANYTAVKPGLIFHPYTSTDEYFSLLAVGFPKEQLLHGEN